MELHPPGERDLAVGHDGVLSLPQAACPHRLHTRNTQHVNTMIDSIVQEVREARAEIAAEFGYDRARFWAWARGQQEAERKAQHQLPTSPNKKLETTGGASKSPVARKRRVLSA